MRAMCECGNSWQLRKNPEEYADGPRCPECESRDVEVENSTDSSTEGFDHADPVATEAFQRFEKGHEPADLVVDGLCSPAQAEELMKKFNSLTDYRLVTKPEIGVQKSMIRREGFEEGYEKGRKESYQKGRKDGYRKGRKEGYQQGKIHGKREAMAGVMVQEIRGLRHELDETAAE